MHLEHSRTIGEPFNEATALAAQAMIATHQGRFGDGEQLALQALRCGQRFDRANAAGIFGVQMFTLRRHQGRLRELAPVLRQFLDQGSLASTWRPGLAILHCELGARDEAQQVFDALAGDGFAGIAHDAIRTASLAYLAEVCAWLGDARRAPRAVANCCSPTPSAASSSVRTPPRSARPTGCSACWRPRCGSGTWRSATSSSRSASTSAAAAGPGWRARAATSRRCCCSAPRQATANVRMSLVDAALDEARALGLGGHRAGALALQPAARAGFGHASPRLAGLSARELQVLRLVAAGKTNPQIAAALHRSPATVAIHVRNILDKTQSANRAEAAAFAARHGLLAPE